MFKLMGKEINAILSVQTILIWTYVKTYFALFYITTQQIKEQNNDEACIGGTQ